MDTCTYCSSTDKECKKCTGCASVTYCSKECQTKDWKQSHKKNCKLLKKKMSEAKVAEKKNKEPQPFHVFVKDIITNLFPGKFKIVIPPHTTVSQIVSKILMRWYVLFL